MLDSEFLDLAHDARIVAEANRHVAETDSYHARMATEMRKRHFYYNPPNGDQWPEDLLQRPGKIHITANIVKPAVNISGRLQGKLPRITLRPADLSEAERARAELVEKMMLNFLEASGWALWMQRASRTKALYGKAILKVSWNKEERRPDVDLIEEPYNVRLGWGSSDFRALDWALYEYTVSPQQVMERWPNLMVENPGGEEPLRLHRIDADHADPLDQKPPFGANRLGWDLTDYEKKQVLVWDYWYKADGTVYNCTILQKNTMAKQSVAHKELPDIPYIVIENDHDPGSPEGMSMVEDIIDLQIEFNRALSQFQQVIVDNLDPAWQNEGVDTVIGGVVPRAGEIIPAGEEGRITPIEKPVNTFPVADLIREIYNTYHRITGLGEIQFGAPASAQDSGRALAVQIEAALNRVDPQRIEFYYGGLRQLLVFWTIMLEKLNPKIGIPGSEEKKGMRELVKGLRAWNIVAPEITPRDAGDHTNNVINKVNAKLISLRTGMDELGVESPEDEVNLIAGERSSIQLFPGDAQAMAAVGLQLLQMAQAGLSLEQLGLNISGEGGAIVGREGANKALADQQLAQPQATTDQNQPATGAGGAPPLAQTTLVRSGADQGSQALNQLAIQQQLGG